MVSSFSRLKQGEKSSSKTLQEDELQEDIVMLLNLLSNLLVNECENDMREEIRHGRGALSAAAPNGGELDVPQLAFSSINHLLRLTNRDLLDYPALCLALLDLVCELVSFFPQRLNRVDQGLFQSVFRLLRYGVETANTDANKFAYTAIGAIAAHRRNMELLSEDPSAARLDTELDQTFWAVMKTALQMGQLPNELIESASEATYIGIMTQLGASARTSDSTPRLKAALSYFNSALDLAAQRWIENYHKVLQTADNASDSASFLSHKGRTTFVRGILEVRGLLRVI
ncbi:hypothetical protein M427DRAFT_54999 [Gonapodya prolifera JEL478]|uniref:Uncharacterized protein n=1 Tax=Gonapodya prolifera (strain JEL478) TaxID=1344416 RepID=A0A139AJK7_GONPJ|nr:hypothetical protein M427DRAFT_54999 [Gonapodya prolifera JEL478]|eukprot:KXS16967.1 hypothetical protein M427DRAFT_54999 [Gonapodya prolifera JEL478]